MSEINETISLPAFNLKVRFNPDGTPEDAMREVDTICAALARQDAAIEGLRITLGRVLVQIRDKELFKPKYTSFEQFTLDVAKHHKLGSRTILRDCMAVVSVEGLADMTPKEAEDIPWTNMILLPQAVKSAQAANSAPAVIRQLRKDAAKLGVVAFREKLEKKGLVAKRGRPMATKRRGTMILKVRLKAAVASLWRDLVGDQDPEQVISDMIRAAAGVQRRPMARARAA